MPNYFLNLQKLFSKKWFFVFALISLLFFQLTYSFLSPSVGSQEGNWEPINTLFPKFTAESSYSFISDKIYPLISQYSLYSDSSYYLTLGRNFSREEFDGHLWLGRPLWPFLIFLPSIFINFFVGNSYIFIFGSAILLNFILMSAAVLLFFLLLKELISLKVAWLSSILLIFSPFVHGYLNQPTAEILMAFAVVFSMYLLHNYIKKPSIFKLIVFSLILGILMLGKMFFAISIFILLLAVYFKRYKEGIIFSIVQLIPLLSWYLWVTQVWQISFFSAEIHDAKTIVWLFGIFQWPWQETYRLLLRASSDFINVLIYSFLLIPVVFSIIGWRRLLFKSKNIIYFGAIFSLFVLGFVDGRYNFRHFFLLFPIIYPTCVLGIEGAADSLKKYKSWLAPLFYIIIIGFIILISNINIYQIFRYNDGIDILI